MATVDDVDDRNHGMRVQSLRVRIKKHRKNKMKTTHRNNNTDNKIKKNKYIGICRKSNIHSNTLITTAQELLYRMCFDTNMEGKTLDGKFVQYIMYMLLLITPKCLYKYVSNAHGLDMVCDVDYDVTRARARARAQCMIMTKIRTSTCRATYINISSAMTVP